MCFDSFSLFKLFLVMLFGMENIYSLPQNKKRGQNQQTHPILNAAPPSIVYHARGSGNDSRRTSTRRQR
jgi:hypothetical protein